ncbi:Pol, partial [Symbiodinium necroappetens]
VSLLGLDSPDGQELFSRIANHQTAGDLVEAWSLQLWERGYRSLCEQLSGYFLLHNVLTDIPPRFYTALGQEWRITWAEFKNVMRAWLGDSPAPALPALDQVPAVSVEPGPPGRLSELLRARSLSPRDGPLLGRRTDLIDGATDARVFPTILLPYTFPAFQVGSASPLQLQDQPECAYMAARSTLYALGHQRAPLQPAELTMCHNLGSGDVPTIAGQVVFRQQLWRGLAFPANELYGEPLVELPVLAPGPQSGAGLETLTSSTEAWLEVQIWLHEQEEHDVILLQETHWRFTSSWNVLLVGGDFNSMGTRDSMPFGPGTYLGVLARTPCFIFCAGVEVPVSGESLARAPTYQLTPPPERVQAFCEHLASILSAPSEPSELDHALQQAAAKHLLPVQPRAHGDSVLTRVTGMVKQMWNLRHTAQQFALEVLRPFTIVAQIRHWRGTGERLWYTLGQLLSAWRHQAAYLRQHRHLRRRGRQAKKELLEEQLQQAWEADRQGDKSSIWKVVNKLAPRTARVKIQLRGDKGGLLTPVEEAERLRTYCEKIYKLPPPQHSDSMATPSLVSSPSPPDGAHPASSLDTLPAVQPPDYASDALVALQPAPGPLEVPHLTEALSLLPARKATPPHLAQLHLWHLGKEALLPHLATLCKRLWRSPHQFHQLWADAWIAWLAKPGKAPDQPENLRPISLTEGGGRIVVKALTLHLRPSLTEATWSWPQYAYVPGRSIEHAIVRALHHCSRVQAAIASQRVTLQERRTTGRTPTTCQGGVTLSIDTSKAFDTVDRGVLEQELKTARIPEPELTLIMSLHQNIGYWPAGPGSDVRVSSERGVRQGCPLAPSLWTLVTVALLRAMAGADSLAWIQDDTTMFADDLLLQWEYTSIPELERMLSTIQECFRVLARLGLQVQHRKTQLLVAHKGRLAHRWWQMHTASTTEGRFLRIPQPNQKDLRLPIVTQLTYLGIVL